MRTMRTIAMMLVAMAIVSCTGKWQHGQEVNNGHDFLCSVGVYDDSLNLSSNELRYDDDGEKYPHRFLDLADCQALGMDLLLQIIQPGHIQLNF